jgi:NADH-quinone oxidoreductase subunit L
MLIGTLAITGVGIPLTHYGFAGFLSKDAVIESAWVGSNYAFWLLVIAACMTSFYSWRLMFMTFYGESRAGQGHGHDAHHGAVHDVNDHHDDHGHHEPHESPMVMLIPLGVLALGAVFSGMLWYKVFFGEDAAVRDWFGMEEIAHAEGHGDSAAEGHSTEAAPAEVPAVATESATEAAPAEGTNVATEGTVEAAPAEARLPRPRPMPMRPEIMQP